MSAPVNPPAFPADAPGITLRDWFAGRALAGLVASPGYALSPDASARMVYGLADAMLAQRGGGGAE